MPATQEVHYEGRLERRVDSNGYTSWDPCWCELNDGEFKYAPVVEPPGGGGNDHAYTSSGSGGSSSNTKGGSAHSQDRSGGSLRNSNHRSGSSEEHPDRRISSGGGSVPLESAVAVRTVSAFFVVVVVCWLRFALRCCFVVALLSARACVSMTSGMALARLSQLSFFSISTFGVCVFLKVRGAPHSFTVVVADGSGLVFRASDRSTYQVRRRGCWCSALIL